MSSEVPLCVDLDGTLTSDDTVWLALVQALRQRPLQGAGMLWLFAQGRKAEAKTKLARIVVIDPRVLRYDPAVQTLIADARARAQPVWLVTASPEAQAHAVSLHLGGFDRVLATGEKENLLGPAKAARLRQECGVGHYDYVGDSAADFPVWRDARKVFVVGGDAWLATVRQQLPHAERISRPAPPWLPALWRLGRIPQWSKNLLLFVPVFTAHLWRSGTAWGAAVLGFVSFGLVATAIHILNDVVDLPDDRRSPAKAKRALVRGDFSVPAALGWSAALLLLGFAVAQALPGRFTGTLAIYAVAALLYSWRFRGVLLVDVLLLAGFYVLRISAGAAAVEVPLSNWLLSFSALAFFSLALLKRYAELIAPESTIRPRAPNGRDYQASDIPLLLALGGASSLGAVILLALFVDSTAAGVYRHPHLLWFSCPIVLYWLARNWFLAARGIHPGDPIAFALGDRTSYLVLLLLAVVFFASV